MEKALIERLCQFREDLHKYPELSGKEKDTQDRIRAFLTAIGCKAVHEIAGTGLLVRFRSTSPGPHTLFRADIDALPIREINAFGYKSVRDGVSHMCGHDGHTAILCGLAATLIKAPPAKGTVTLLFQPAEENGAGAKAVLEDPAFDLSPDWVFALHNLPGYPRDQIICREGSFTPSVISMIINLEGKTSHAAEPELGINPAKAVASMIQRIEASSQSDPSLPHFRLSTPVCLKMGSEDYGISAGSGELHYTLRTWDTETMHTFCNTLMAELEPIAISSNLEMKVEWLQEFRSNQNHPNAVEIIRQSARDSGLSYGDKPTPFKWGEDFGLFTERFNGAMFGIGAGEHMPALHNPDYDFPNELIPTGVTMFQSILRKLAQ